MRGTSPPSVSIPFDVAVASTYINVTDLTMQFLPDIYDLAGSSIKPEIHRGLFTALEKERACGTPLRRIESLDAEVGRLLNFK